MYSLGGLHMGVSALDRKQILLRLALGLLIHVPCLVQAVAESPEVDCPAAFRIYSSRGTPLLDLLLNPAAKAVVDRDLPGFLSRSLLK
jgi:ABC-type arginine/histidine transport system permease subunit